MSATIEFSLSEFDNDDIIGEFFGRLDQCSVRTRKIIIEKIVDILTNKGYVVVLPKYMDKKIMLEDFITENDIND